MARTVYDKLRALQDVLSKKFEVEKEIQEIPKSLATKTELLNRLKKSFMEKSATYQAAPGAHGGHRARSSPRRSRSREKFEGQMDVIKTQREYEALDKEIKDATEKEQQLRKELQREQTSLEELKGAIEKEEMMIQQAGRGRQGRAVQDQGEDQGKERGAEEAAGRGEEDHPGPR